MEIYIFRSNYLPRFDRQLLRDALLCYRGKLKADLTFLNDYQHIKDCAFCIRENRRKCPEYYICFSRLQETNMLIKWLEDEFKKP